MGQKVNPTSLRVGINKYWQSTWFEKKDYSNFLKEDHRIRSYIEKNYSIAGISSIIIERAASNLKIIIHTSKPGVLIGKKGADIEKLRNSLSKLSDKNISLDIKEIKKPETDASLLADSIARQLEKRIAFRKAMKKISAVELMPKLEKFNEYHKQQGTDKKFIPLPETWLRGERWNDEIVVENLQPQEMTKELFNRRFGSAILLEHCKRNKPMLYAEALQKGWITNDSETS